MLALTGRGQIHQISLKTGDEYVVHPSNVVAYSMMQHAPQPYRFKSSSFRLQIPNPFTWLPDTRFWRTIREAPVWRYVRDGAFMVRTWTRRTIWGDRVSSLFLNYRQSTLTRSSFSSTSKDQQPFLSSLEAASSETFLPQQTSTRLPTVQLALYEKLWRLHRQRKPEHRLYRRPQKLLPRR